MFPVTRAAPYRRDPRGRAPDMAEYLTQHLHTVAIDVVRLCLWLIILSVIFVPLERLFAIHRSILFRAEFGNDLGWYFINALFPALLLSVPLGIVAEAAH